MESKVGRSLSVQVRACFRTEPQVGARRGKSTDSDVEGSTGRRFKSCQPDIVMSQDIAEGRTQ